MTRAFSERPDGNFLVSKSRLKNKCGLSERKTTAEKFQANFVHLVINVIVELVINAIVGNKSVPFLIPMARCIVGLGEIGPGCPNFKIETCTLGF